MDNIYSLVKKAESSFVNSPTTISKYVSWSLHEEIEKVEAYSNSKHISGETDSMGREKPFFDITNSATNIWYRATDIDRKNITIKSTSVKNILPALGLNYWLQSYMKEDNFGKFLNHWGRTLAKFGSSVVKIIEKGDDLSITVVPWTRLIIDSVDFANNPVIEKLYMTPAQLLKSDYDQDVVKTLFDTLSTRKTADGQDIDSSSDYVEVYEVHGELPLSFITDRPEDMNSYVQQMHVVTFVQGENGEEDTNFCLYKGREKKSPYKLTHLIEEDGRTMGRGAPSVLFEAQWMVNHTAKAIKDQLDLASQLIFQTSDPSFIGQNVLQATQTGDILVHSPNQPLTQVANNSHDISALQGYSQAWQNNAQMTSSTPDAISGATMPSGTAYRQVAVLNQEAHSLFELMIENKALHLEEIMREDVIPHLIKKMDTTEEIAIMLDDIGVREIDAMYIESEVNKENNKQIKEQLLSGKIVESVDTQNAQDMAMSNLKAQGSQRFIKPSNIKDTTWKELLKDIKYKVDIVISNENSNKEAVMTTLTTMLQTIASNPNVLLNPTTRVIMNKIIEETGVISAIDLGYQPSQSTEQSNVDMQIEQKPIDRK
jgi:hypothetical protein